MGWWSLVGRTWHRGIEAILMQPNAKIKLQLTHSFKHLKRIKTVIKEFNCEHKKGDKKNEKRIKDSVTNGSYSDCS